ncbi:MAG: hypothetical protein RLZZ528_1764 [Pseudomonadota bacterium]
MTNPRRIALVTAFPPGGLSLNEYGFHLARSLASQPGVADVVVIADIASAPVAADAPLHPKFRVCPVWAFNSLATLPRILRALRREAPDGVIFNLQMASYGDREVPAALGLLAPLAARLAGYPTGVIAHNILAGVDLDQTVLKGRRLRQAVIRAAGHVITRALLGAHYMTVTLGTYVDLLKARYPGATGRLHLVPHGTFDTGDRPWVAQTTRPDRIVTMGKFGTYKRLETLLAAFDILRQDPAHAGTELVIGGTDHPNTPGYVAALAAARAGDSGVRFAGYVAETDVPAFFEGARLSVFDYQATTGSSGVLHQSAAYGAVPVFPRIGDFVDLCEDEGLSGLHYEPGDAAGLARAMAQVLGDSAGAEAIARANHRAALGMPMSEVAAFHLLRLAEVGQGRSGPAAALAAE